MLNPRKCGSSVFGTSRVRMRSLYKPLHFSPLSTNPHISLCTMPRKFLFISNIVKFLRVDLALFRQNIDKGEPTDTVRALRFNISLQTEDIRKTLGPNCSENYVKKWKVGVARDY